MSERRENVLADCVTQMANRVASSLCRVLSVPVRCARAVREKVLADCSCYR